MSKKMKLFCNMIDYFAWQKPLLPPSIKALEGKANVTFCPFLCVAC